MVPQGDSADCFYIVESGEVRIMIRSSVRPSHTHTRTLGPTRAHTLLSPQTSAGQGSEIRGQRSEQELEVARCTRGQYFGELALVTNKPRAASVYAAGDTRCLGNSTLQLLIYR